jgi:hypothetical protein
MGEATLNRAARRRAIRIGKRLDAAITRAAQHTVVDPATQSPKAVLYRILRTLEEEHGPESTMAKLARARFKAAFARLDEHAAEVERQRRSFRGRLAAFWAMLTALFAGKAGPVTGPLTQEELDQVPARAGGDAEGRAT